MVNNNKNDNKKKNKQTKTKKNPTQTNGQLMHNAIALLTDSRPSFLNPDWTPLLGNSHSLYNGHDVLWCRISLWSVQVTCPSCASIQFLLCSAHWQSMRQGGKNGSLT